MPFGWNVKSARMRFDLPAPLFSPRDLEPHRPGGTCSCVIVFGIVLAIGTVH